MSTRAEVVGELRSLFKEGATPSRLIRHIVERHQGERFFHLLIQEYFMEAFGVPIVRGLNPIDDFQQADLRYAYLNEQLLHEMILRRGEWDNCSNAVTSGTGSWLEALRANDDQERIRQLQETVIPELSRCWAGLSTREQHYIHRSMASANGLHETVKILSRLAECLQQKIVELEGASTAALEHNR
jgi:hypothetical protein